jgi:hypothetical protein
MTLEYIAGLLNINMDGLLTIIGQLAELTIDEWACWNSGMIPQTAKTKIARAIAGLVRYARTKSNDRQRCDFNSDQIILKIQEEIRMVLETLEENNDYLNEKMELFEHYRDELVTALASRADISPIPK